MNVNIQKLLEKTGLIEKLYPGKRVVRKLQQPGKFKSHCVVYDWHRSDLLRIEIKAGLTGKNLDPRELAQYPVSFQAATYMDIVTNTSSPEDEDDTEGETESGNGKSGGGGKKPLKRKKRDSLNAFSRVTEGNIPSAGDITKMVVMGKDIAKAAMGAVLETLAAQIQQAKIAPTDLLARAGKFVTKVTPPAFIKPKEGEAYDAVYKYDRQKNEMMFGGMSPG
ncbi:MAG: hypothetical protein KDJ15_00320 [Alphaproteobacteria bacterium]|nr:hypothetical protein [Alphaproteobacteria bacterium]